MRCSFPHHAVAQKPTVCARILQPDWLSQMLSYDGDDVALAGSNLLGETRFIVAAVVVNLVLPPDASQLNESIEDQSGPEVMKKQS